MRRNLHTNLHGTGLSRWTPVPVLASNCHSLNNVDRCPAANSEDARRRVHGGRVPRLEPPVVGELLGRRLGLVVIFAEDVSPADLEVTGNFTLVAFPKNLRLRRTLIEVG